MTLEQHWNEARTALAFAVLHCQKIAEEIGETSIGPDGQSWLSVIDDLRILHGDEEVYRHIAEAQERVWREEREAIRESDAEQRREWAKE